jgi:hypothetical protein
MKYLRNELSYSLLEEISAGKNPRIGVTEVTLGIRYKELMNRLELN